MKLIHIPMMDEERIAAYIDGKLSPEEMNAFSFDMAHDDTLADFVSDFKNDLNIVDNDFSIEKFEPNFDSVGALDSLFTDVEQFQSSEIATPINSLDTMDTLQSFLGMSSGDPLDIASDDSFIASEDIDISNTNDNDCF